MPRFLLLLLAAAPAFAVRDRIPADAPYCAPTATRGLFLSPAGEPFRGAPGDVYPSLRWFDGADRNRDGAVDRAEAIADAARFFGLLDRDKDGRLLPAEIDVYERDVAPEVALYAGAGRPRDVAFPADRGGRRPGDSGYGGPLGAGRYAWLNVPEPVAAADADMNRVVDAREFAAAAARRFDALVSAGAGGLRRDALPRTPQQRAIEGPCHPRPRRLEPMPGSDSPRSGEPGVPR